MCIYLIAFVGSYIGNQRKLSIWPFHSKIDLKKVNSQRKDLMLCCFLLSIWQSSEPWKYALSMNDKYYLPVPPLFSLVRINNGTHSSFVLSDVLTAEDFSNETQSNTNNHTVTRPFSGKYYIDRLNKRISPQKDINDLIAYCESENISKACLILGRIFEFGSYNQSENLHQSYKYYNKALSLNDSSANSPLAFFHRHIFPNIPLSIIEDDYNSNFVESILVTSNQYESGFLRPQSCISTSQVLISLSRILVDMYFKDPYNKYVKTRKNISLSSKHKELMVKLLNLSDTCKNVTNHSKNGGYSYFQQGISYLTIPYPTSEELDLAVSYFEKAICAGSIEALPYLAQLVLHEVNSLIYNLPNEKNEKLDKLLNISFIHDEQFKQYLKTSFYSGYFKLKKLMAMDPNNFQDFTSETKDLIHYVQMARILQCLDPLLFNRDPETLILVSSLFTKFHVYYRPQIIRSIIQTISETGYPPAVHQAAEFTYYGLFRIPRSAKAAYKLYIRAAASNYIPSMLHAAQQLLDGEGVNPNCQASVSLLRAIVDSGPWSTFYDKYVSLKQSKVAFIRMLEMGLTPPIWLNEFNDISEKAGNIRHLNQSEFDRMINQSLPFSSYITKGIFLFNLLPSVQRDEKVLQKIREIRNGNYSSLLWLVLHSRIRDSLIWLDRLESLPFDTFYISQFARFIIMIKGIVNYRNLDPYESSLLKMMLDPYMNDFLLIICTIALIFLVSIRLNPCLT